MLITTSFLPYCFALLSMSFLPFLVDLDFLLKKAQCWTIWILQHSKTNTVPYCSVRITKIAQKLTSVFHLSCVTPFCWTMSFSYLSQKCVSKKRKEKMFEKSRPRAAEPIDKHMNPSGGGRSCCWMRGRIEKKLSGVKMTKTGKNWRKPNSPHPSYPAPHPVRWRCR